MLIAFSTIPGYVSNRDREKGTWFIQSVCKVRFRYYRTSSSIYHGQVFSERACTTSLRDMLDLVALDLKNNHESEIGTKQSFNYDVSRRLYLLFQIMD